jgi:hypothetical protein
MKLTKGKISKLHHKKRQSVRKYKKRAKRHHKTRTLRRKYRPVNLVKSTLKNYNVWLGGKENEEENEEEDEEKTVDEALAKEDIAIDKKDDDEDVAIAKEDIDVAIAKEDVEAAGLTSEDAAEELFPDNDANEKAEEAASNAMELSPGNDANDILDDAFANTNIEMDDDKIVAAALTTAKTDAIIDNDINEETNALAANPVTANLAAAEANLAAATANLAAAKANLTLTAVTTVAAVAAEPTATANLLGATTAFANMSE